MPFRPHINVVTMVMHYSTSLQLYRGRP